ncbi:hypothetical protein GCM10017668_29750 [Streptomyces tuirus]|uniref:Uncharacterized protein n=1 Tax=Streptomyces tuirus TaxID=68278 RepID=A0A7G1NFX6_9ACTN|nr:hypothetical protein GCM10017668_29750 [Streptomyces tuirus]
MAIILPAHGPRVYPAGQCPAVNSRKPDRTSAGNAGWAASLVVTYAHRWGVVETAAHGKTVWAEPTPGRGDGDALLLR